MEIIAVIKALTYFISLVSLFMAVLLTYLAIPNPILAYLSCQKHTTRVNYIPSWLPLLPAPPIRVSSIVLVWKPPIPLSQPRGPPGPSANVI